MGLKIKSNIAKEKIRFDQLDDDFAEALITGMRKSLQAIGQLSASDYLQGPRPEHLDTVGGRLIRAIMGAPSFTGGVKTTGAPAVSRDDSIREVKKSGKIIKGTIGVETFDPFDYPKMWEETGHKEILPKRAKVLHFFLSDGTEMFTKRVKAQEARPFLEPAGEDANSRGILDKIFEDEFEELKLD